MPKEDISRTKSTQMTPKGICDMSRIWHIRKLNFIHWHQGGASALCNWSKQIGYTMQNAARVKNPQQIIQRDHCFLLQALQMLLGKCNSSPCTMLQRANVAVVPHSQNWCVRWYLLEEDLFLVPFILLLEPSSVRVRFQLFCVWGLS